jgi:hypothetical protein
MIAAILPIIGTVLDRLIPDVNARERAKAEIEQQLAGALERSDERQVKVNEAEVSNGQGGWRHQAAMLCVYSLGYAWLGHPIMSWALAIVAALTGKAVPPLPVIPVELQYTMLTSMLGLAGIKAFDLKTGTRK